MANVYQRGTEYIYQQNEVYYQGIEYFYWPTVSGSVNSIYDGLPIPPGIGATLDYENIDYVWQDGYNKIFGLNIEFVYSPGENSQSVNSIYDGVLNIQASSITHIYDGIVLNTSGNLSHIYDGIPQSAFGSINHIYDSINDSVNGYIGHIYDSTASNVDGSFNSIYDGITIRASGFVNSIYDGLAAPVPTGSQFIMATYMPFAPRRIPFIFRYCGTTPAYPTGGAIPC